MTFNPILAFRTIIRSWGFLILALVISLSAALYQRLTGPTHPKRIVIPMQGKTVSFRTLRSHETTAPAPIVIPAELSTMKPYMRFKRYPTNDDWTVIDFKANPDDPKTLVALLPVQPSAGKVEYQVVVVENNQELAYPAEKVRLRYKDPVPDFILIPHVYSMFAALMFGAWAFLEALFIRKRKDQLALPTAVLLCTSFFILGGFILGPIVQKYAFGEYWTGFPFGDDFTDNKVLFSIIFWLIACFFNFKRPHAKSAAVAAVIMFAMYMIPHSFGGSQFDYSAGKIKTGLQKQETK